MRREAVAVNFLRKDSEQGFAYMEGTKAKTKKGAGQT